MNEKIGVEISQEGNAAIVAFKATTISSPEMITIAAKQIQEFINESHPSLIVFNFEQVKFFSSQVLGLLLDIRSKMKAYGGEVVISAINPQLYRVFKITNLDKLYRFFPDKESAVGAANKA